MRCNSVVYAALRISGDLYGDIALTVSVAVTAFTTAGNLHFVALIADH